MRIVDLALSLAKQNPLAAALVAIVAFVVVLVAGVCVTGVNSARGRR